MRCRSSAVVCRSRAHLQRRSFQDVFHILFAPINHRLTLDERPSERLTGQIVPSRFLLAPRSRKILRRLFSQNNDHFETRQLRSGTTSHTYSSHDGDMSSDPYSPKRDTGREGGRTVMSKGVLFMRTNDLHSYLAQANTRRATGNPLPRNHETNLGCSEAVGCAEYKMSAALLLREGRQRARPHRHRRHQRPPKTHRPPAKTTLCPSEKARLLPMVSARGRLSSEG